MWNLRRSGTLRILQLTLQRLGIRGRGSADLTAVARARRLFDLVADTCRRILRCIVDGLCKRAASHECSGRGCKQQFPGHAESVTVKWPLNRSTTKGR